MNYKKNNTKQQTKGEKWCMYGVQGLIYGFASSFLTGREYYIFKNTKKKRVYKKHFLYINKEWTAYTVEDISGADVTPYHYEINILPEMIQPFEITTNY